MKDYLVQRLKVKEKELIQRKEHFKIMVANEIDTGCFERNAISDLILMLALKVEIEELKSSIRIYSTKEFIGDVTLTEDEIDDLITGCYAQISDYCCSDEEEKPFRLLIEKLNIIKGDD